MTNEEIIKELSGKTVLEINDLVKALEEAWGVSAAAAVAVAAPGAGGAAAAEEKTEFDVILKAAGANKIARSSRRSARLRASASRTPRTWSTALPRRSRKPSRRTRPRRSPSSSRRPAPKSRSSNLASTFQGHEKERGTFAALLCFAMRPRANCANWVAC